MKILIVFSILTIGCAEVQKAFLENINEDEHSENQIPDSGEDGSGQNPNPPDNPENDLSIASRYQNDIGIENDPDVIFA